MVFNRSTAGPTVAVLPPPRSGGRTAGAAPHIAEAPPERPRWQRAFVARLVVVEVLLAAVVTSGSAVLAARLDGVALVFLVLSSVALAVAWPAVLALTGAYEAKLLGTGSDEYRLVGRAGLLLLATAAFASYTAQLDVPRSLVVLGIPALTGTTLVGRLVARRQLRAAWARGRCTRRTVLVGRDRAVLQLAERLDRERFAGLEVVAACVTEPAWSRVAETRGLPVAGLSEVLETVRRHGADTVAVTTASETADEYLRSLSWQLEGTGVELLVAPGLVEVAGPRLHIRPLEGLPLLTIEPPRFAGWSRVLKAVLDRSFAAVVLVLLAPVLLGVALAVRASSPGPVLFRQERIGRGGQPFQMLKFRSMVVGADQRVAELRDANVSDGLLFKVREDPRVTPVGRWLRRYSLDELPQLLNVLTGSMSLVGPRPPLPAEVERYTPSVSRRLLVKPGLTGLWQISGRSDLPWEETVRLDLRYVENWSLALDALILWKTGRAVVTGSGAY
jgi:exopolysaccharide biosynthesis polyprenyl glycosylphosphotransferase